MALKYVSDCVELLVKLTFLFMFVCSTSSTKQCTPKKKEGDGHVIRNVGIKLCQLKCSENGQCLSIEYDIETLTCRLSGAESKKVEKKEGQVILATDHSQVLMGSCTSNMCSFGHRCLETRSGKAVCVQDEKQSDPEKFPQQKDGKLETFANNSLHEACRQGDLNRVRDILSKGFVDVNSRDENHGRTPLMLAAKEGRCKVFNFLMRMGANMSDVDNDCRTALHWACKGGHVGIVDAILPKYGIVKNMLYSPLLQAAWKGYTDVVEFLVCTGSNVSQVDSTGSTILHHASVGGHMGLVKYIVSQGSVDINSRRKDGRTALMHSAFRGHTNVFEFLVSRGANVSLVDDFGHTILHLSSQGGHMEMVKLILSKNLVDINARDKGGKTAAMTDRTTHDVQNLLVSWGCPVE